MKDKLSGLPINVWNPLLQVMSIAQKENCIKRLVNNNNKDLLEYVDTFTNNNFFYKIISYSNSKVRKDKESLFYEVHKNPSSSNDSKYIHSDILTDSFTRWLAFVKKYKSVALIEDEDLLNSYGEEFYKEMNNEKGNSNDDDDESDEYLDIDAQIRVDQLLEAMEHKLIKICQDNDDPYIASIKEEVSTLRDTQSKYKKKELKKYIARILAKIRALSIKLLKEFWDTGKKEIYKRIINGGIDDVAGFLDGF